VTSRSLPSEVCTVVSDADCVTPVETVCGVALPSPDCQLVLRQFFNGSGEFCVNVSLTNDVSLAVTSARVSVTVGTWGLFFYLILIFFIFLQYFKCSHTIHQ
jgi:melanocyte protein PMEL